MPTTISQLEIEFSLKVTKSFKWGTSFFESENGIYIISASSSKYFLPEHNSSIAFKDNQFDEWRKNAPNILLNGKSALKEDLMRQLKGFWLPDESILYIGKAEKQTLSERICQFYNHKVGKKSPHKGGYWLKLLSNLNELHVHLLPTKESHAIEEKMLEYFINNVSTSSKEQLIDKSLCLPFANLQLRSRVIKAHELLNHYQ